MEKKKIRIILDTWIARIGAVFGWICLVFWAMMGLMGLVEMAEAKDDASIAATLVCIGLAAVHWLLIRAMRNTKELVQDFRLYSSVLAQDPDKEIDGIAEALKIPEEQVMKRLQAMCRRGYFSGHINFAARRMELEPVRGLSVEHCPGCGATTAISRTGDTCRYCGAPLKRTDAETGKERIYSREEWK